MNLSDLLVDVKHYGVRRTFWMHMVVSKLNTQADVNKFLSFWNTNTYESHYDATSWIDAWYTKLVVQGKTPDVVYQEIYTPVKTDWLNTAIVSDSFQDAVSRAKQDNIFLENFITKYGDLIREVNPKVNV